MFPLILVILVFLLVSDAVSYEIDEGSYKVLLLQSVSRGKVLFAKMVAYIITSLSTITGIFAIFYVGLGIIKGFGSPNYPVSYYTGCFKSFLLKGKSYEIKMMDIRSFILIMIPLFILFLITVVMIAILISVITENSTVAMSCSIIIYTAFYIFSPQLYNFSDIAQILPVTYFNIPNLLDGTSIALYKNMNITYINGAIVFIITILICYIFSLIVFKRRNFYK